MPTWSRQIRVPVVHRRLTWKYAVALGGGGGAGGGRAPAPKTMTGRLYSGAGPLDLVAALLAMRHSLIPPTVHVEPDPEAQLDLVVGQARPATVRTALVLARGYGGFNSALVLTNENS
ncbi:hypothetical protein [Nocardia brasiliensis]|uniref:hypothetical protein n=1 Tax=Nocardia brasiliensis TaxID=37326 RepID=UPI00245638AD|nr:hypothetical protein [Nocardia brasiliensis]